MQARKSWLWTFGLLVIVMGIGPWLMGGCPSTGGGGGDGEDLCADVQCDEGQECDPDTGECIDIVEDLCADVQCDEGRECDPDTGECIDIVEDLCADVQCDEGRECDPETGACVEIDLCEGVECAEGEVCNPATGACVAEGGADGAALYADNCSGCHGADGSGPPNIQGVDAATITAKLAEGGAHAMQLTAEEVAAIAEFLGG